MKYSYFPGCCYDTSAKEYEMSSRAVCRHLGIELVEAPDWNCCGSTAAHSTSHLLGLGLAARNLALAESTGLDVVAPCAACYQRLAYTDRKLKSDAGLMDKVNQITDTKYRGSIRVLSMLEVIAAMEGPVLRSRVVKPLDYLRPAAYYGCLLLRPPLISVDDPENPQMMEKILRRIGAAPVDWYFKTECCGAGMGISNEDVVLQLVNKILAGAAAAGANCIVTACPLCHFNLDLRQKRASGVLDLPVFYFTQLVGVATGLHQGELSLGTHFVDTLPLLAPSLEQS
jgi:heterodisulfide reductase subunit B